MNPDDILYYGPIEKPGHYLWSDERSTVSGSLADKIGIPRPLFLALDGGAFCPPLECVNGRVQLNTVGSWTILSWWDRSCDRRPGSHSNILSLPIREPIAALLATARLKFQGVFDRQACELVLPHAAAPTTTGVECHGLDTPERVCFYEHDFYPLSNFSSFALVWREHKFPTSEHAYHWEKFKHLEDRLICNKIATAPSAHEAFKLAEMCRNVRRPDWDEVKVGIMHEILLAKVDQHEYARRKLLDTGDRELVEDSWRDDFWGWGASGDGQNQLGKLWMEIRAELGGGKAP